MTKIINCQLVKGEIINLEEQNYGEAPHYILLIERANDSKFVTPAFVYLSDSIDNVEQSIFEALRENKLLSDKHHYKINLNNSELLFEVIDGIIIKGDESNVAI